MASFLAFSCFGIAADLLNCWGADPSVAGIEPVGCATGSAGVVDCCVRTGLEVGEGGAAFGGVWGEADVQSTLVDTKVISAVRAK